MIFPILGGLLSWRRAPLTWTLTTLNFLVLLFAVSTGRPSQEGLEDLMQSEYFVTNQGRIYAQYLHEHRGGDYPDFLKSLGTQVREGRTDRAEMLGQLAFRDLGFLKSADTLEYDGDQVAFKQWRKRIGEIKGLQESHPSFTFGLNGEDTSFQKWVTYIFVHSGMWHLFGNMLFFLIFGSALERQIGGLGLLVVFLLSGITAAGTFAVMTGVTSSPLVGASGAVSGVMTLYCFLNFNRKERYFYWLFLPFRGFMGFIYLPAWVALVLWAVSDLAGYLGTLPELGGVAYTAHLGGEVAGLLAGLTLWALRRRWPLVDRDDQDVPMGVPFAFLPPIYHHASSLAAPPSAKVESSDKKRSGRITDPRAS